MAVLSSEISPHSEEFKANLLAMETQRATVEAAALQASDNATFDSLYDRLLLLTPANRRVYWQTVFTEGSANQ